MPVVDDGAVAAGQQSGAALPNAMRIDGPPPAPSRPLRIKKKVTPGNVPPTSASAAPMGGEARPPVALATKTHAWQHVTQVEEIQRKSRVRE